MGRGDRNYFRHSTNASQDEKICKAIDAIGREAYFYYFSLIELCVSMADEAGQTSYTIHQKVISNQWRMQKQSAHKVLTKLQQSGLLVVTKLEQSYQLDIPNLMKYFGSYAVNKRKEIKLKEIKLNKNKKEINKENPGQQVADTDCHVEPLIISIWNTKIRTLPKVKTVSANRKKRCSELLKQHGNKEYWVELVEKINETPFLNGANKNNWKATFDWVIKADNRIKILEGNYTSYGNYQSDSINGDLMRDILGEKNGPT